MIDLKDRNYCPTLEEIGTYVNNPVFRKFCSEIQAVGNPDGILSSKNPGNHCAPYIPGSLILLHWS